MKLKSFLFLIAALAMGLAFASCGGDDTKIEYRDRDVYKGVADDVDSINALFGIANDVYLTKDIAIGAGQSLSIGSGKTLHLEGYTIAMGNESSLIATAAASLDWGKRTLGLAMDANGGKISIASGNAYLIGPAAAFSDDQLTGDGMAIKLVPGATTLSYNTATGRAITATSNLGLVFNADTGVWAPSVAEGGTKVVFIGNLNIPNDKVGGYTLYGSLSVAGDVTLAGTLAGAGTLEVFGNLKSDYASNDAAARTLVDVPFSAYNVTTKGGKFGAAGSITVSTLKSAFSGTLTTFDDTLYSAGAVEFSDDASFTEVVLLEKDATFTKDAAFTAAATIGGNAIFSGNVESSTEQAEVSGAATFTGNKKLTGYLKANSVTLGGPLTITSGSLSTGAPITLGNNSIILSAEGGIEATATGILTGTSYNVSVTGDGGSLLNNAEESGTNVTFAASGITTDFTNQDDYTPTIVFGGAANLVYTADAEINGYNLDVANGGTISLTGNDLTLTITNGGSITAANVTGTLGAGNLYIVTHSAGSLVAGTLYGDSDDKIKAGSYGTLTTEKNFIYSGITFELAGTLSSYGKDSASAPDEGSGDEAIKDEMLAVFDDTAE
ncbi:MAG: hypothetical protein LBJ86_07135 [Spirochaetaceae bacterium]|jgi:hypothetical protein|nr:hypothetical protein [Spirochaetaceae bacterium]